MVTYAYFSRFNGIYFVVFSKKQVNREVFIGDLVVIVLIGHVFSGVEKDIIAKFSDTSLCAKTGFYLNQ